ncbi:MAG: hypothetical protein A2048_09135 [Deltaproteobacteria bacterium GWA2_45_12]|nr:MAG: hypothetical protein A2048_09135 [Deltaproteobacteria bacterium GWA2_45_12]
MKRFSATEARVNFFKILDLSVQGETVIIERNGIPIHLVPHPKKKRAKKTDYSSLIHSKVDDAETWSWEWEPNKELTLRKNKKES